MAEEKTESRPSKRVSDPEIQAIASIDEAIGSALYELDEPAKSRVLWYVGQRWFGQKEANG